MSNVIYGVIAVILLLVMIFYKIWIGAALGRDRIYPATQ